MLGEEKDQREKKKNLGGVINHRDRDFKCARVSSGTGAGPHTEGLFFKCPTVVRGGDAKFEGGKKTFKSNVVKSASVTQKKRWSGKKKRLFALEREPPKLLNELKT